MYDDDKILLIVRGAGDRRLTNPYRGNPRSPVCVERLPSGSFFFLARRSGQDGRLFFTSLTCLKFCLIFRGTYIPNTSSCRNEGNINTQQSYSVSPIPRFKTQHRKASSTRIRKAFKLPPYLPLLVSKSQ